MKTIYERVEDCTSMLRLIRDEMDASDITEVFFKIGEVFTRLILILEILEDEHKPEKAVDPLDVPLGYCCDKWDNVVSTEEASPYTNRPNQGDKYFDSFDEIIYYCPYCGGKRLEQ